MTSDGSREAWMDGYALAYAEARRGLELDTLTAVFRAAALLLVGEMMAWVLAFLAQR